MRIVLILFDDSPNPREGREWVNEQVRKLAGHRPVAAARLRRAQQVAEAFPRPCGWLLELQPADGETAESLVKDGEVADLLLDLRLLGMRPAVLALDGEAVA